MKIEFTDDFIKAAKKEFGEKKTKKMIAEALHTIAKEILEETK